MKKTVKLSILSVVVVLLAIVIFYALADMGETRHSGTSFSVPTRLVENGPYGKNVDLKEKLGRCMFDMKAQRLYFKKIKTLGFNNALFKKLVAKELNIIIFRDNKKILSLYKDYQEMNPNMKSIQIKNPKVLYPETMKQPDEVNIDKDKKLIVLRYGDKVDTWDLTAIK